MREYRTRLIVDVVTGKVDVRGVPVEAAPLNEVLGEFIESEKMEEVIDVKGTHDANG